MFRTAARIVEIAFLAAATGVLVWFLAGKLFGGQPRRELDPYRRVLAERVVREVAAALPRRDEIRKLVVAPVYRDLDGRVTDLLYEAVEDRELYFLVGLGRVREVVAERFGGAAPANREQAIELGRALAAGDELVEGVLFSELGAFTDGRRGLGAEVELRARLIRLRDEAEVPGGLVRSARRIDSRWSVDWLDATMRSFSGLVRLLVWLLFTGGLPFALHPVVVAVVRRRSNRANAWLLAGLVGASVLCGLVLMGLRPGWGGAVLLVLAALLAFVYHFAVCDRIDEAQR